MDCSARLTTPSVRVRSGTGRTNRSRATTVAAAIEQVRNRRCWLPSVMLPQSRQICRPAGSTTSITSPHRAMSRPREKNRPLTNRATMARVNSR